MVAMLCGCGNTTPKQIENEQPQPVEDEVLDSVSDMGPMVIDTFALSYLDSLPEGCGEEESFRLVLSYADYYMEVTACPLHNDYWVILSHWCIEEEGVITETDENGNEVPVVYQDPFEGRPYPVVYHPLLSFDTRNYGGETIHFYMTSDGEEVYCSTNYKNISLHVIDGDPVTRRLLVYSTPEDWCWGEPEDEWEEEYRHPFVELRGWIDEEWVCSSTMTTCP